MGGAISLLLAERQPFPVDGLLVLGRGLEVREEGIPLAFSHRLEVPTLLLTNQSETEAPRAYANAARAADSPVEPVLWVAKRDGHIRFTVPEYRGAVDALLRWMAGGKESRPGDRRLLIEPLEIDPPYEVGIVKDPGSGKPARLQAWVSDISPTYGNFEISMTTASLDRIGLELGDRFRLWTGEEAFEVRWANTYTDVPRGNWVAFENEFGLIQVAINHGDAAGAADIATGEAVQVSLPADPSSPRAMAPLDAIGEPEDARGVK